VLALLCCQEESHATRNLSEDVASCDRRVQHLVRCGRQSCIGTSTSEMGASTPRAQLGPAIRALRECVEYSQQRWAEELGVHLSTIQRWEHGGTPVPRLMLEVLKCRLNHESARWRKRVEWHELIRRRPEVETLLHDVGLLDLSTTRVRVAAAQSSPDISALRGYRPDRTTAPRTGAICEIDGQPVRGHARCTCGELIGPEHVAKTLNADGLSEWCARWHARPLAKSPVARET
jgi:DNA-binding XRE family transcriptional regulator